MSSWNLPPGVTTADIDAQCEGDHDDPMRCPKCTDYFCGECKEHGCPACVCRRCAQCSEDCGPEGVDLVLAPNAEVDTLFGWPRGRRCCPECWDLIAAEGAKR